MPLNFGQPALGKPKSPEASDLEAGGGDGGQGVAAGVAAAHQGGPEEVGESLDPSQPGGVGSDVLEEAQLPAGSQHSVELGQGAGLIGTEHSTREATAASMLPSGAGRVSALRSTTRITTGACQAATSARPRRYGSGSTARTSVTAGG
jgi:hypothetical protein